MRLNHVQVSVQFVTRLGLRRLSFDNDCVKLRGQRKAAELYRSLIPTATGRKRRASLQNLACCLKRIAGMTGDDSDYLAFKTEVNSYPSDKQLWEETTSVPEGRIELTSLWQGMMSDAELFALTDHLNGADYKAFWISLLDQKVVLRQWKDDLAELQSRNPKMKEWAVIL